MEVKDFFNYGVPTGLLVLFLYASWRIVAYLKTNVMEPTVKNHLKLIEALNEHLPRQTAGIEQIIGEERDQTKAIGEQAKAVGKLGDVVAERTALLTEIVKGQGRVAEGVRRVEEKLPPTGNGGGG